MYYNEKKCDGCAEIMHDGEDIVVCPVCGTPQHRECYNKNKMCVNEHLHAEGFDWNKENIKPQEEKPEQKEIVEDKKPLFFSVEDGIPDIPLPVFDIKSVQADGKEVEFDGVKLADAANYTQINTKHYINKFIKHEGKKGFLSWNWAAFLFGPAWFFYRKIYNVGAFFLAVVIAATLAVTPFSAILNENYDTYATAFESYTNSLAAFMKDDSEANEAAFEKSTEIMNAENAKIAPAMLAVYVFTFILPHTAAALVADGLYRKKMLEDIKIAKKATSDPNIFKYSLIRRGGVSLFAGLASIMAKNYLPTLIMTIISNFI